jgi:hypothetical protein
MTSAHTSRSERDIDWCITLDSIAGWEPSGVTAVTPA